MDAGGTAVFTHCAAQFRFAPTGGCNFESLQTHGGSMQDEPAQPRLDDAKPATSLHSSGMCRPCFYTKSRAGCRPCLLPAEG